jgi:hypothetical protein
MARGIPLGTTIDAEIRCLGLIQVILSNPLGSWILPRIMALVIVDAVRTGRCLALYVDSNELNV